MSWRPKDWKNGWDKEREFDGMASKAEIFEAGADAMLRALKDSWYLNIDTVRDVAITISFAKGTRGALVLIPEEEKVKK